MSVFRQQKVTFYACVRGQRLNEKFQKFHDSVFAYIKMFVKRIKNKVFKNILRYE